MSGDRDLFAFLCVTRNHAEPGGTRRAGLKSDVKRPCGAAADPDAFTAANHPVIRSALRDGQIE